MPEKAESLREWVRRRRYDVRVYDASLCLKMRCERIETAMV